MAEKFIVLEQLSRFKEKVQALITSAVNGKVDAVDGKGLSTNDLTNTLKSNYDAAYTHSNNGDVHVTTTQKTAWDGKADGDHNHDAAYAAKTHSHAFNDLTGRPSIPTTVAELTDADDYAKKTDIAAVYRYCGSVATEADLPENATAGDVYNVESDGGNRAWTGTAWDNLGGTVEITVATNADIDALFA